MKFSPLEYLNKTWKERIIPKFSALNALDVG